MQNAINYLAQNQTVLWKILLYVIHIFIYTSPVLTDRKQCLYLLHRWQSITMRTLIEISTFKHHSFHKIPHYRVGFFFFFLMEHRSGEKTGIDNLGLPHKFLN